MLTESTNSEVEDKISNFEKEIKKTEKDFINPKTAFRKNSPLGKLKKKPVKEDRGTGQNSSSTNVANSNQPGNYNAGWNAALQALNTLISTDYVNSQLNPYMVYKIASSLKK